MVNEKINVPTHRSATTPRNLDLAAKERFNVFLKIPSRSIKLGS